MIVEIFVVVVVEDNSGSSEGESNCKGGGRDALLLANERMADSQKSF